MSCPVASFFRKNPVMNTPLDVEMKTHQNNVLLQAKYNLTAYFYDILDYPWERTYRQWRTALVGDIKGKVLEAGVGSGRNLAYYNSEVDLLGIELSLQMLRVAEKRAKQARCKVRLVKEDATLMRSIKSNQFDWIFSTFMCCVMADDMQPLAVEQFGRVLKKGGKFRLLEIVYSRNPKLRKRQELFAPFVEKIYGARFDRHTLGYLERATNLKITNTYFLKEDMYLLIEGVRI